MENEVQGIVSTEKKKKGLAIASLCLGIVGMLLGCILLGILLALPALILGIIALKKHQSKPLSILGIVSGSIGIVISLIMIFTAMNLHTPKEKEYLLGASEDLFKIGYAIDDYLIETKIGDFTYYAEMNTLLKTYQSREVPDTVIDFKDKLDETVNAIEKAVEKINSGHVMKDDAKVNEGQEELNAINLKTPAIYAGEYMKKKGLTKEGQLLLEKYPTDYKTDRRLAREEAIAKKQADEEAAKKKKDEEEATAKKKAEEEAATAMKAEEDRIAAEKKAEEDRIGYATGITYDQIARDPYSILGQKCEFSVKVTQVISGYTSESYLGSVNSDYTLPIYIDCTSATSKSSRILEGDYILVQGKVKSLKTYTTVLGAEKTVPQIEAEIIGL